MWNLNDPLALEITNIIISLFFLLNLTIILNRYAVWGVVTIQCSVLTN